MMTEKSDVGLQRISNHIRDLEDRLYLMMERVMVLKSVVWDIEEMLAEGVWKPKIKD